MTDFDHVDVEVDHWPKAMATAERVQIGRWFAFERAGDGARRTDRLHLASPPGARVHALANDVVELDGLRLHPNQPLDAVGLVLSDRDLYRAEEDTVNLFVCVPNWAHHRERGDEALLSVTFNGDILTTTEVRPDDHGVCVDSLSMLLPGDYSVELMVGDERVGRPADFVVAHYTLAPLSAQLQHHALNRGRGLLEFSLAVESYQLPFEGRLEVTLVDRERETASAILSPSDVGRYEGGFTLEGDGPFRLRLMAADDAERVCEVILPGSRARERELTVIGELGAELRLSLMAEPGAIGIRGAFLTEGDARPTPIVAEGAVGAAAGESGLRVTRDVDDLVLIVRDALAETYRVLRPGSTVANTLIPIDVSSPLTTVFAGAWIDGRPFEGYASFVAGPEVTLSLDVPEVLRPREELELTIRAGSPGGGPVPVLLRVRDERLTATDSPERALAAGLKEGIETATAGLGEDYALTPLELEEPDYRERAYASAGAGIDIWGRGGSEGLPEAEEMMVLSAAEPGYVTQAVDFGGAEYDGFDTGSLAFDELDLDPEEEPAPGAEPSPARDTFPEQLYYGLERVEGELTLRIPLPDSLGTFVVEAFAIRDGDWAHSQETFCTDQPVRVDLDLPPMMHESDRVRARLHVATESGRHDIALECDGQPVEVAADMTFALRPGEWSCAVTDPESGVSDRVERFVGRSGQLRSLARQLRLVQPGEKVALSGEGVIALRVLPAVDAPAETLFEATASYAHLCCEQTAAKILAACGMYLTADGPVRRKAAHRIILAGVAREETMWQRGRGFAMYPGEHDISDYYSPLAARYLWALRSVRDAPALPHDLQRAVRTGLAMADDAAEAHGIRRVPESLRTLDEAWAHVSDGRPAGPAVALVDRLVDHATAAVKGAHGKVETRRALAYAAAVLLRTGDVRRGARLASVVTSQLGGEGRLYSTVDSVAAIALLVELKRRRLGSDGKVRVNGRELTIAQAATLTEAIEVIEVLEGVAAVEVQRVLEDRWERFEHSGVCVDARLEDRSGRTTERASPGDRLTLRVTLPEGAENGDLAHVALPPVLSRMLGGGRVKAFTADFELASTITVPVLVTGTLTGPQHWSVCVRNMFEEERGGWSGLQRVG